MANIVERLAETAANNGVRVAYGEKITVDGVELVPVALAAFGFGGGEGEAEGGNGEGSGGGGGGYAIPVGAYVGGVDGVKFRPNLIALLAVSIPVVCSTGWALSRIIRALKK